MNVGGNHSYDWQPLVKDYGVDVNNMSLAQNGGQYALSVPYHLSVSDWIVGQSLDLKVTMGNSSATLATTDQHIILQQSTNGTMVLNVSGPAAQELISHPEQLHFGAQAGFLKCFGDQDLRLFLAASDQWPGDRPAIPFPVPAGHGRSIPLQHHSVGYRKIPQLDRDHDRQRCGVRYRIEHLIAQLTTT